MIAGKIRFVPERDGYRLPGTTSLSALFDEPRVKMASPRGSALRALPVEWEWRKAA